jgi:hypothetical protein
MQRLYGHEKWGVVPINPKTDKVARALSGQPAFSQHFIYAPTSHAWSRTRWLFPNSGQESDRTWLRWRLLGLRASLVRFFGWRNNGLARRGRHGDL